MSSDSAGLKFTGHPLVDVGVAGVCAFTAKNWPEDVTLDDLDLVSDFLIEKYYSRALGTYLSCVFMNASFVQPNESKAKSKEFQDKILRAHRAEPDARVKGMSCVFAGLPATAALVRTHLPLFSGEEIVNFRPAGQTFVPVAGAYVVPLMFLPMAGRRSEGRLLVVHSVDSSLMIRFAKKYLADNQRLLSLQLPSVKALVHDGYDREQPMWDATKKKYKFADAKGPRSLVVSDLTTIASETAPSDISPSGQAVTAYLLSNSGQDPSLQIFEIPAHASAFILRASEQPTRSAWKAIASSFRELGSDEDEDGAPEANKKRKTRKKKETMAGRAGWTKNPAFEDLCGIFDAGFTDRVAASGWLKKYILGTIEARTGNPKYARTNARNFELAKLFLEEVLGMKKARIEAIREFADRLAEWINGKNDKRLFNALARERPWELRQRLLQVQRTSAESKLLFTLDDYARVWLHEEDGKSDESLVRDLICIRVVEKLHEAQWFSDNPDVVIEETDDGQPAKADTEEVVQ